MKQVPALTPCPSCSVPLEEGGGPHGLAWHGCEPDRVTPSEGSARAMLFELAAKPDLTVEDTVTGLLRAAILQAAEGGDPMAAIGAVLEGLGKMKASSGGAGPDDLLRQWAAGRKA